MFAIIMAFVVLIFDSNAIAGTGSHKHFQILTTYAEVEKKAVEYAKSKNTFRGTLNNWRSYVQTDICSSSPIQRIEFCKKALHVDIFGFEFDLDHYRHQPCEQQNFWIKSQIPSEAQPFRVDMFSCPKIIYRNEETDEEELLPYIFAASRATSHDKALIFVRENTSKIYYPFQYIKGINFEKLKTRNKGESSTIFESMIRHNFLQGPRNNLHGLSSQRGKKYKIYMRFIETYSSINLYKLSDNERQKVCFPVTAIIGEGRPKSANRRATVDVNWYRRHQLILAVREIENLETDTFSMWECRFISDHSNYRYFVGKTLLSNAAVLYRLPIKKPNESYVGNEVYAQGIINNIDGIESIH